MHGEWLDLKQLVIGVFALFWFSGHVALAESHDAAPTPGGDRMRLEVCIGCHQPQYDAVRSTAHWMRGDPRTPASVHECSTCHGELEEHVLGAGKSNSDDMKTYKAASLLSVPEQNAVCMGCHKDSRLLHWQGGAHAADDVGCVGCHRIHQEDRVRSRQTEKEVCFACHTDQRSQSHRPYGHPLREGKVTCSDCHNAHGGPGDADLKTFGVNETCYSCHAEKRGPFLWEHVPASEDCLLCHTAHGSINKDMLARRQPHLCQSCHEPTGIAANPLGPHAQHSRLALSFREPGAADQGPDPAPGSRGISRLVMGQGCSNCHVTVHGSNHPAGAKLMR